MMRTSVLITLLASAALVAIISGARLRTAKQRAQISARELSTCKMYLTEIRAAGISASQKSAGDLMPNSGGINQLLRESASTAGAGNSLTSIESGKASRIAGTDYDETPIYLRVNALPMKQLVMFLYEASAHDSKARCRSIELSAVENATAENATGEHVAGEHVAAENANAWSADVTMGYLSYSPHKSEAR